MRTAAATRATRTSWMPTACVLLCVLIGADLAPARGQTPAGGPDFDALAARALSSFEVPGLALAVVKDGRTVVTKGYGVRALGVAAPVDEHTLFAIASNSKVFTAAALGILVDEKKVEWDAPVVRYLP